MRIGEIERVRLDRARIAAVEQVQRRRDSFGDRFDRLSRIAVEVIGAPAAFVSLVADDADYYVGAAGLPEPLSKTRRLEGGTFCHYGLVSDGVLLIDDARTHTVLRNIPTVVSLGVVAYAGVPLRSADGQPLGAFCVIDNKPRRWSEAEVNILVALARVTLETMISEESGADSASLQPCGFASFYDAVGPVLYALFLRVLRRKEDAVDLLRSFMAEKWSYLKDGHWQSTEVQARMIRDGRDLALLRRGGSEPLTLEKEMPALPASITEKERRILSLSYFDGLPIERIAEITESKPHEVRTQIVSAMRKIRAESARPL